MDDHSDYQTAVQAHLSPRNSPYAHHSNAHTRSWVYANQQNPPGPPPGPPPGHGPPPPRPINYPSPVQTLRPLPNPHPPNSRPLRVINNPEPELFTGDDTGEYMNINPNDPGVQYGYQTEGLGKGKKGPIWTNPDPSVGVPRKKKTLVGGLVKGIRRLPKAVFGYGAGIGGSEADQVMRTGTFGTEGASMSPGSTLPLYTSNPSSPVPGLGRSGPVPQYVPGMFVEEAQPTFSQPPPDVVRISDHNPSFRVTPPSEHDPNGVQDYMYPDNGPDYSQELAYENPAERTTMMVYNDRTSYHTPRSHPTPLPTPPTVPRQLSTSPGLSYMSEPLPPLAPRSTSMHGSLAPSHVPPPIDIPQPGRTGDSVRRVSYASQIPPRRATPQSLIPGAFPSSNGPSTTPPPPQTQSVHTAHSESQAPEPMQLPAAAEEVLSPVSAHPGPTADYLKMTLSPSPTSHITLASGSSYYDPSFSSQLNPVERFFKTLYHMPWISQKRVTVDYLPGQGMGKRHGRRFKPMASWYQSLLARSNRSSGTTLDLLSNGAPSSPHMSLGEAGVLLSQGSPVSGSARRSKESSDMQTNRYHRSHVHHSSSHEHHHTGHTKRKRPAATWMDSRKSDKHHHHSHSRDHEHTDHTLKRQASSPLIPPVYPFQFPPYPYPGFPPFSLPMPAVNVGTVQQEQEQQQSSAPGGSLTGERTAPRGPRAPQQQSILYAPPGYASYQPMATPPQMYIIQSPMQTTNAPPEGHNEGGQGEVQPQQTLFGGSGMAYMQSIPGTF